MMREVITFPGGETGRRRRAALARYAVLDTAPESEFDDIVRAASAACGMPVSLISLLDADRQWFKAETGFGRRETPLSSSICAHAVQQDDLLVIPDTTEDPRTATMPIVTGDPHARFYAGVPLRTSEGVALGTLCVLDTKPNTLTQAQALVLRTLARQVMTTLELRRALKERRESDRRNEAILESAVDYGIISMDLTGHVTSWSAGAERILGWSEAEMLGRHANVFFTERDTREKIAEKEMGEALLHGQDNDERWHLRKDGSTFYALGEMMPLLDGQAKPEGFIKILRDRTEQRLAEDALAASEARWRGLFTRMQEGFFLGEILRDAGRPVDVRFLEVNTAFAAQAGLPADAAGRTMRQLVPSIPASLIEACARVVDTSVPETFELAVPALARSFEVRAQAEAGQRFSALFLDVTQRKQAEVRRTAMLELGDRLRDVEALVAIGPIVGEVLGRALDLTHAGYGAVDEERGTVTVQGWTAPGLTSLAGVRHLREYGSYIDDLEVGRTVLVRDVATDGRTAAESTALAAIDIGSLVNLPVLEHGRFVTLFFVAKSAPHDWTAEEVAFLRDVADRARAAIARLEAEEQQRVLNLELSHRMKNMLAMVQSIATQTLRGAADVESVRETLSGRLVALGRSHDLLLGGSLGSTSLDSLVANAVALHRDGPERIVIGGPALPVGAKAAMSLSLILHELATNAAKYGALSTASGQVAIRWEIEPGPSTPQVRLRWSEAGGPPVTPPTRAGFGTRLIGRGLASNFGGEVDLAYRPAGVTCTIVAPLSGLRAEDAPDEARQG